MTKERSWKFFKKLGKGLKGREDDVAFSSPSPSMEHSPGGDSGELAWGGGNSFIDISSALYRTPGSNHPLLSRRYRSACPLPGALTVRVRFVENTSIMGIRSQAFWFMNSAREKRQGNLGTLNRHLFGFPPALTTWRPLLSRLGSLTVQSRVFFPHLRKQHRENKNISGRHNFILK